MTPFVTSAQLGFDPRIRHGFFGRQGGVSTGDFAGLNVSYAVGDAPEIVRENRALVAGALGANPLIILRQTHSDRVITITDGALPDGTVEADALVTNRPEILLGILTADCAPLLFADPVAGVVGAAHAGWKGAAHGISLNTIKAMTKLGAKPANIDVVIGPTISGPNYEVGPQFMADFLALQPDAGDSFSTPSGSREHFDLGGFLLTQLAPLGLRSVSRLPDCTYADPARYFSHRYTTHKGTKTGRQVSVIGLT